MKIANEKSIPSDTLALRMSQTFLRDEVARNLEFLPFPELCSIWKLLSLLWDICSPSFSLCLTCFAPTCVSRTEVWYL